VHERPAERVSVVRRPGGIGRGRRGRHGRQGGGDIFDGGFQEPVVISPVNPVMKLEVPLQNQTIQFYVQRHGHGDAGRRHVVLSSLELGTISDAGSSRRTASARAR
jgi:hypothetical protein